MKNKFILPAICLLVGLIIGAVIGRLTAGHYEIYSREYGPTLRINTATGETWVAENGGWHEISDNKQ
ncbi:MAG TPA: hypothetical protein VMG59_11795 [Phycisphaerae bacterium]|nr:hypothetical protein [Phycisphaerae bacterium]